MAKYLADQNKLCFFYEPDTYGTGSNVGTGQWVGLVQEHTVDETVNVIPIRYQGSTDRNVDTFAEGALDYAGTFTYFPQDWKFLLYAVGSIHDASGTTSIHTATETNSDNLIYTGSTTSLPTFSLEDSKTMSTGSNFNRVIKGCMVDSYTVNWAPGEITSCEVNYIAQAGSMASGASTNVTASTSKPHMWNNTLWHVSGGGIPNDAVITGSLSNITDASLTITNNIEPAHYLNGSKHIKEPIPLNRDLELTMTMRADSDNLNYFYNNFYIGGSEFNTRISSINSAGSVFITLSGCKVTDMEVPSPVEGLIDNTLTIVPQHITAIAEDAIRRYASR